MTEHHALAPAGAAPGGPVLGVLMAPEFVAERVAGKRGVSAARPFGAARAPLSASLRGLAERLAALIGDPASGDAAIAETTSAFAAAVLDAHARPADSGGPAFDYRIRRAIQIAAREPTRAVTVEAMLEASELSRSRFFELFRACVGATPQIFLDARADDVAIAALARSDAPIAQMARDLGFANADGFSRLVRRATGLTPRDFRRAAVRL